MTSSFWLILSAALVYGLLHSLLASLKIKSTFENWLAEHFDKWFRILYNGVAILTLLPILGLIFFLPDAPIYVIHFPWVVLTLLVQIIAVSTLVVGLHQTGIASFLGLRQLLVPRETEPITLVTGGLYRYVRHPLYTAGLVFIWLVPTLTWNVLAFNIGITAYILVGIYFEEKKLRLVYGEAYDEYRRKTAALFPGIRLPDLKHIN